MAVLPDRSEHPTAGTLPRRTNRTWIPSKSFLSEGAIITAIVIIGTFLRLFRLELSPDYGQDEALYGAVALEVLKHGQILYPYSTAYEYFFLQPPLFLLGLSFVFRLAGFGVFQTRLLNSVFGVLTILLLYVFIRKHHSKASAIIGAAYFAVDPYFLLMNRWAYAETLATFFSILSVFLFYEGHKTKRRRYAIGSGVFLGFALLTKFMTAAVLFMVCIYSIMCTIRRVRAPSIRLVGTMTRVAILVASPYILYALFASLTSFAEFYWQNAEQVGRALGISTVEQAYRGMFDIVRLFSEVFRHIGTYLGTFVIMITGLLSLPILLRKGNEGTLLVGSWCVAVLVFFTVVVRLYHVQYLYLITIPFLIGASVYLGDTITKTSVEQEAPAAILSRRGSDCLQEMWPNCATIYRRIVDRRTFLGIFVLITVFGSFFASYHRYHVISDDATFKAVEYVKLNTPIDAVLLSRYSVGFLADRKFYDLDYYYKLDRIAGKNISYVVMDRFHYDGYIDQGLAHFIKNNCTLLVRYYGYYFTYVDVLRVNCA